MTAVKGHDAAEVTAEAVSKVLRAFVTSKISNKTDRRAVEFVIVVAEEAAKLVIEAAKNGNLLSKAALIKALTKRSALFLNLLAPDVDIVQCYVDVVELVLATAESTKNTVLIAKATTSAVTATAPMPIFSAFIGLAGTALTVGTVCAAAFELVEGFLKSLDSCGKLLAKDPRAIAAMGRMRMVDGMPQRTLMVA